MSYNEPKGERRIIMIGKVVTQVVLTTTSIGTGVVVGNVLRVFKPTGAKVVEKTLYSVGTYALGGVAGIAAVNYVNGQIEDLKSIFKSNKETEQEVKEEE